MRFVVRDGLDRSEQLIFIPVPDLHDVSVGWRIEQFKNVGSRLQHLPRDFYAVTESYNRSLVRLTRPDSGNQRGTKQQSKHCNWQYFEILHDFLLFDMVWQIKLGGLAGVSGTPIRSVLLMHCRHRGLPGYLVAAAG